MFTQSTQQPFKNTISGFPILPLSQFQNERFTEPLNTRIQLSLYNHIQEHLGYFGVGNLQDLVRLLMADFISGEIVHRLTLSDSNDVSTQLIEAGNLIKQLAEKSESLIIHNDLLETDKVKLLELVESQGLKLESFRIQLESIQNQTESDLNQKKVWFEPIQNQTESEPNQDKTSLEAIQNQTESDLNQDKTKLESIQNQTESELNQDKISNESIQKLTKSGLNQEKINIESIQNQAESILNQPNSFNIKDESEIKRLNEEISDNHDYIHNLKQQLEEALINQQIPEGYQLFSPAAQAELEYKYMTAINKAQLLNQANELLATQLGETETFDDSHTSVALCKMAKDIAKASRIPFHSFSDKSIINLFLKYYKIESDNAKVSLAQS